MILVDATVLIDYLRTGDAALLATMQSHGAAVCGSTRAEILHGARGPKHRQKLVQFLNTFPFASMPDAAWDAVGDNLAILRANGLTVQFPDAIVATMAILLDVEAWARDQHFDAKTPSGVEALPRTAMSDGYRWQESSSYK